MSKYDLTRSLALNKLGKDLSDAVFRLTQMFLAFALVTYFYKQTNHWIALCVASSIPILMAVYVLCAPQAAVLEFEKTVGEDDHTVLGSGPIDVRRWI